MSKKPVVWVYWIATSLVCAGYLLGAAAYTFNHDMVAQGMQAFGLLPLSAQGLGSIFLGVLR